MNESDEKMCLENIEEFLMDHEKIVTYKYLSHSLNISANDAKRLLGKYAATSDKKSELSCVFAVGGELKDNGGFSVIIAQDNDLESVKSQFEKVSWEVLYSLQKVGQLKDLNSLHIANSVNSAEKTDNSFVGIPYWKDTQRDDTMARNRVVSVVPTSSKPETKKPEPKKPATPPKTPTKAPVKSKSSPSPKKDAGTKDKNSGNKSGGIAAMFAAQKTKKDSAPKSKAKPEPAKKGSQSISSFFSGQAKNAIKKTQDSKESTSTSQVPSSTSPANDTKSKTESQDIVPSSVAEPKEQKPAPKEQKPAPKEQKPAPKVNTKEENDKKSKKGSTSKKPTTSKKNEVKKGKKSSEPPQKKRKRVMLLSDSENSSQEGSDAESERSNSPEPERSPSPQPMEEDDDVIPATPLEPTKKRKRKVVDKTVMGEDGFFCTTKEFVYESCSDNEENDENKKTNVNSDTKEVAKPEKEPEPKKSVKQPTKQQSLTSFFKKK